MIILRTFCCEIQLPHWPERKTITVNALTKEQAEKAKE